MSENFINISEIRGKHLVHQSASLLLNGTCCIQTGRNNEHTQKKLMPISVFGIRVIECQIESIRNRAGGNKKYS